MKINNDVTQCTGRPASLFFVERRRQSKIGIPDIVTLTLFQSLERAEPRFVRRGLLLSLDVEENRACSNFLNPKRTRAASHNTEPRAAYGNTFAGYSLRFSPTHETTRLRCARHHFDGARHRGEHFDL